MQEPNELNPGCGRLAIDCVCGVERRPLLLLLRLIVSAVARKIVVCCCRFLRRIFFAMDFCGVMVAIVEV